MGDISDSDFALLRAGPRHDGRCCCDPTRSIADKVESVIEQLGDQDREIILMRHYKHMTNLEIAEVLKLNPPAASMCYLRAVRPFSRKIHHLPQASKSKSVREPSPIAFKSSSDNSPGTSSSAEVASCCSVIAARIS